MSGLASHDHLLGGKVQLEQPEHGYRVAIDAVLAAAAVQAKPGDHILDAGAGTAAIGLCLSARLANIHVTGIEQNTDHAQLACRNIEINKRQDRIQIMEADLFDLPQQWRLSFDHVVTNPPFHQAIAHRQPKNASKTSAGHMTRPLCDWIDACLKRLKSNGSFVCVHKASALTEILMSLEGRCGDVTIIPLWPRAQMTQAKRIIVRGRKTSKAPLRLTKGLILHGPNNSYTKEAEAILRDGEAFGDF